MKRDPDQSPHRALSCINTVVRHKHIRWHKGSAEGGVPKLGLEVFCKKGVSLNTSELNFEIVSLILHRILIESGRIMIEYGQLTMSCITFFGYDCSLFVGAFFSPLSM